MLCDLLLHFEIFFPPISCAWSGRRRSPLLGPLAGPGLENVDFGVLYRGCPGMLQKFWEFFAKTRKKYAKFYSGAHTSW